MRSLVIRDTRATWDLDERRSERYLYVTCETGHLRPERFALDL